MNCFSSLEGQCSRLWWKTRRAIAVLSRVKNSHGDVTSMDGAQSFSPIVTVVKSHCLARYEPPYSPSRTLISLTLIPPHDEALPLCGTIDMTLFASRWDNLATASRSLADYRHNGKRGYWWWLSIVKYGWLFGYVFLCPTFTRCPVKRQCQEFWAMKARSNQTRLRFLCIFVLVFQ